MVAAYPPSLLGGAAQDTGRHGYDNPLLHRCQARQWNRCDIPRGGQRVRPRVRVESLGRAGRVVRQGFVVPVRDSIGVAGAATARLWALVEVLKREGRVELAQRELVLDHVSMCVNGGRLRTETRFLLGTDAVARPTRGRAE